MIIVVMGVSGAGKTTVGVRLAERLGAIFLEGDKFHPAANVAKMKSGVPLDDADRRPWLERLAAELARRRAEGAAAVLACSALKRSYRAILVAGCPGLRLVYLAGSKTLIQERLAHRTNHFMPSGLLDSQFATLEPPGPEEGVLTVEIGGAPEAIVDQIIARLGSAPRG